MNKDTIASLFISKLEDQILKQRTVLEETRKLANESPSASESHSDTSRYQLGQLALVQDGRLKELEETLKILKNLKLSSQEKVVIGAIFNLLGKDRNPKSYFMFNGAQGTNVELDGTVITAVSAESPLGRSVLGKKKGERVAFAAFEGEVTAVW